MRRSGNSKYAVTTGTVNDRISAEISIIHKKMTYLNLAKVGVEGSNPFARSKTS